jgi:type II secretory pathway component PulK
MEAALLCPSMDHVPTKERDMKRLIACVIGVVLLAGSVGLMSANAQQAQAPAFIAGDRPVTAEQVLEKLQTDGWSNVAIFRNGRYIEVTGSMNGETSKMAVDSQTGRLRADNDDDDDD